MRTLLQTKPDAMLVIFRVVLGVIMCAHGAQKVRIPPCIQNVYFRIQTRKSTTGTWTTNCSIE